MNSKEKWAIASELNCFVRQPIFFMYQIMLDLNTLPELTDTELSIIGEVLCGAVIDRRKIRGLHLDVLDAATGTSDNRKKLSAKIETLTAGQRLALVEKMKL